MVVIESQLAFGILLPIAKNLYIQSAILVSPKYCVTLKVRLSRAAWGINKEQFLNVNNRICQVFAPTYTIKTGKEEI